MNIRDIAQEAGVSTATVSRVLNNSNLVQPKTRERVLKVIESNHYAPSAVAKSLSEQNTHNIGVIFPDIENPFFTRALKGISQVAEQSRYNVFLFNADETAEREREFLDVIRQQRLDGVIISPTNGYDESLRSALEALRAQNVGVVLLDRDLDGADFCCVKAENEKGAYLAVSQLIGEGHDKIAIIEGDPAVLPVNERTAGYLRALDEFQIPVRQEYMMRADMKSELAYRATEKLMRLEQPPTAIFTCNNMMTLGCLRYLTENNLKPGRDISLIGFDDIETLRLIDYKLSVVERSEHEMGRVAMQLLLEQLEQTGSAARVKTVSTKLILRGSEKLGG
jgi:LacI family transcriptional regulator